MDVQHGVGCRRRTHALEFCLGSQWCLTRLERLSPRSYMIFRLSLFCLLLSPLLTFRVTNSFSSPSRLAPVASHPFPLLLLITYIDRAVLVHPPPTLPTDPLLELVSAEPLDCHSLIGLPDHLFSPLKPFIRRVLEPVSSSRLLLLVFFVSRPLLTLIS